MFSLRIGIFLMKIQMFTFALQTRIHSLMIPMQNFVPEWRKCAKPEEILGSRYLVRYKVNKKWPRLEQPSLLHIVTLMPWLIASYTFSSFSKVIAMFFGHFSSKRMAKPVLWMTKVRVSLQAISRLPNLT